MPTFQWFRAATLTDPIYSCIRFYSTLSFDETDPSYEAMTKIVSNHRLRAASLSSQTIWHSQRHYSRSKRSEFGSLHFG